MLAMSSQKMADWTSQSQTISERQHSDILFWVSIKALGMIGNRNKQVVIIKVKNQIKFVVGLQPSGLGLKLGC